LRFFLLFVHAYFSHDLLLFNLISYWHRRFIFFFNPCEWYSSPPVFGSHAVQFCRAGSSRCSPVAMRVAQIYVCWVLGRTVRPSVSLRLFPPVLVVEFDSFPCPRLPPPYKLYFSLQPFVLRRFLRRASLHFFPPSSLFPQFRRVRCSPPCSWARGHFLFCNRFPNVQPDSFRYVCFHERTFRATLPVAFSPLPDSQPRLLVRPFLTPIPFHKKAMLVLSFGF